MRVTTAFNVDLRKPLAIHICKVGADQKEIHDNYINETYGISASNNGVSDIFGNSEKNVIPLDITEHHTNAVKAGEINQWINGLKVDVRAKMPFFELGISYDFGKIKGNDKFTIDDLVEWEVGRPRKARVHVSIDEKTKSTNDPITIQNARDVLSNILTGNMLISRPDIVIIGTKNATQTDMFKATDTVTLSVYEWQYAPKIEKLENGETVKLRDELPVDLKLIYEFTDVNAATLMHEHKGQFTVISVVHRYKEEAAEAAEKYGAERYAKVYYTVDTNKPNVWEAVRRININDVQDIDIDIVKKPENLLMSSSRRWASMLYTEEEKYNAPPSMFRNNENTWLAAPIPIMAGLASARYASTKGWKLSQNDEYEVATLHANQTGWFVGRLASCKKMMMKTTLTGVSVQQ